jgi:hypothetical protein
MFVRTWGYTLTRKDPTRPWLILEQSHHEVELPDDQWFGTWADGRWPSPEWVVELDPGVEMRWDNDRVRRSR